MPIESTSPQGFFWEHEVSADSAKLPHFILVSGATGPYDLQISELDLNSVQIPVDLSGTLTANTPSDWVTFAAEGETIYHASIAADPGVANLRVFIVIVW